MRGAQCLHLDLLGEPRLDDDAADVGLYYKFEFMDKGLEPDSEHYWFRVGRILDFDEMQKFEKFLDEQDDGLSERGLSKAYRKVFERNLKRLMKRSTRTRSLPTTRKPIKTTTACLTYSFAPTKEGRS